MKKTEQKAATSRRDEILASAADIFWAKGYHATSMNDLADAMQMRKPSLYHHIKNKETLLYEISVSSMNHIIEAALAVRDADPEKRLNQLITTHIAFLLDDQSRHATALTELRSLPLAERKEVIDLRSRYDGIIDEVILGIQETSGRWPGVDTKVVRLALLGMLNWVVFWYSSQGSKTPEAIARDFRSIFLP